MTTKRILGLSTIVLLLFSILAMLLASGCSKDAPAQTSINNTTTIATTPAIPTTITAPTTAPTTAEATARSTTASPRQSVRRPPP